MIYGFTGTRNGLTRKQKKQLRELLGALDTRDAQLHHGDCVGADEDAHEIARDLDVDVYIHPPSNTILRAYCKGGTFRYYPAPYYERNSDIVRCCEALIVGPEDLREKFGGSGTWQTYRMARACNKPFVILEP